MQGTVDAQLQLKIHQILSGCGFYRLPLLRLSAILRLLGAEEARQAKAIQANTITGLIRMTNSLRQIKQNYFSEREFPAQALEMQEYLSGIVRAVITERYPEGRQSVNEALGFPYSPFNLMPFPAARSFSSPGSIFGGAEMPRPTMAFGNAYLPYGNYSNPEIFYYRMYGGYPSHPPENKVEQHVDGQGEQVVMRQLKREMETPQPKLILQKERESEGQRERLVEQDAERQPMKKEAVRKKQSEPKRAESSKPILPAKMKKQTKNEQKHSKKEEIKTFPVPIPPPPPTNNTDQIPSKRSLRIQRRRSGKQLQAPQNHHQQQQQLSPEQKKREQFLKKIFQYAKKNFKPQKPAPPPPPKNIKKQVKQPEKPKVIKSIRNTRQNTPIEKVVQSGEQKEERKEPSLQLKYYNSITDFDYRVFPPQTKSPPKDKTQKKPNPVVEPTITVPVAPPPPPPQLKRRVNVETQTDLNFILYDFRVVRPVAVAVEKGKEEGGLREQLNNLHIDEVHSSSLSIDRPAPLFEPPSAQVKQESEHIFHQAVQNQRQQNQNFHLGLQNDPHIEHPQRHPELIDQPSELIEEMAVMGEMVQEVMAQQNERQMMVQVPMSNPKLMDCICEGESEGEYIVCEKCQYCYHLHCLRMEQIVSAFCCPRCRIRGLNPYLEIRQVLGEFFLSNLRERDFRKRVDMAKLEYLSGRRGVERSEEIEMRCLRVDGQECGEVTWPDEAEVRINGLKLTLFYQSPGLRRRRDAPLVITQQAFKLTSFYVDECGIPLIQIALRPPPEYAVSTLPKLPPNNDGLFLIGVYHTFKPTICSFFKRVSQGLLSCGEQFLQGLVGQGQEVGIERELFHLNDPFTGQLMDVPVRGVACRHGQCFDLRTFLAFMPGLRHRAWRCPVCGKDSRKLVLDLWMQDLIQMTRQAHAVPEQIIYSCTGSVTLKMGKPQQQQGEESSEQLRKAKKIKKKALRVAVKREEEWRGYERLGDIDKYFTEDLQKIERRARM